VVRKGGLRGWQGPHHRGTQQTAEDGGFYSGLILFRKSFPGVAILFFSKSILFQKNVCYRLSAKISPFKKCPKFKKYIRFLSKCGEDSSACVDDGRWGRGTRGGMEQAVPWRSQDGKMGQK
jgi:hypothetical protein